MKPVSKAVCCLYNMPFPKKRALFYNIPNAGWLVIIRFVCHMCRVAVCAYLTFSLQSALNSTAPKDKEAQDGYSCVEWYDWKLECKHYLPASMQVKAKSYQWIHVATGCITTLNKRTTALFTKRIRTT